MEFYIARVADKIGRPHDVIKHMNRIIEVKPNLNLVERNLWSTGLREISSSLRNALRTFEAYKQDCVAASWEGAKLKAIRKQMEIYYSQLVKLVEDSVKTIDNILIPESLQSTSAGFYHKMKGDLLRYAAEFSEGENRTRYSERAETAYRTALQIVSREVTKADPLFLGIALNFAVCEVELCGKRQEAIEWSEHIFSEAVKSVDGLGPDDYQEATSLMQLLRENITQWSGEESTAIFS